MPTKAERDPIYRARESFAFTEEGSGVLRIVQQGQLLAPNDEAVKTRRDLVEPVTGEAIAPTLPSVEQATAAPGELRNVKQPPDGTVPLK